MPLYARYAAPKSNAIADVSPNEPPTFPKNKSESLVVYCPFFARASGVAPVTASFKLNQYFEKSAAGLAQVVMYNFAIDDVVGIIEVDIGLIPKRTGKENVHSTSGVPM